MAGDRIAQALARIDAAADRIAAAVSGSAGTPGDGDSKISNKYDALRSETSAALAELDRLIGSLER